MALQKEMRNKQVLGIVGEFSDNSPKSARAYVVFGKDGKSGSSKPTYGKFFSFIEEALNSGSSDKATCAKQGASTATHSMGILVNPKESFTNGFVTARTAGTFVTAAGTTAINGTVATIATRGHIWVFSSTKTQAGAAVFVNGDGDLGDSSLTSGTRVLGAKWLRTEPKAAGKTEVLSEIAIDNPVLNGETTSGSL